MGVFCILWISGKKVLAEQRIAKMHPRISSSIRWVRRPGMLIQ
jgi:hypothetical protein